MASSSSSHNYEVFLSFRGVDTRRNFTDHLYRALDRVGVRTFRDNEELKQGKEIGPELLKAIKESKISIPVFSENYASSKWCLKELAKIMDCRETDGQVVWPIFYKVEPSDVRNQSRSFAQAFIEHEETQSKETLDKWREALSKAGTLSGWDSKNRYEAEMIDSIVEKALNELNKNTLEVAEHPIGMDSRVEEVLRLIDVESRDVQFVGIHGIGGIGKTTLAKAVFNKISGHFEGCCFLRDVREGASQYKGLVNLQNDLISDILKRNDIRIRTVDEGINVIKQRICSKKVLVILDNVDQYEHLNKLAGGRNWFGPGSTIIITTRDKHILNVDQVDECKIYMSKELDVNQSLQLFSNHAFRRHQPPEDFRELSEKFLDIIGGLPLALTVVGSFLRDKKNHEEWESELQKLNRIPNDEVQEILKISYDGLNDEDKEIFLDIACFFIGMDEETIIHILEDNSPRIRIKVLVLKSLVRIDHDNKLRMHDLLRDMGREIVRKKRPNNLGKRSRLWSHDDALSVLKKGKGTQNVEGLLLNFGSNANDRYLKVEAFEKMSELRLLQIDHAYLEGDFDHFPRELKWLSWKGLPSECIPTISHLEKLSVLDLSGGMITDDWSGWQHIQLIKTLKVLDLRDCLYLTRTPDFSSLTSLERLILDGCERLVACHESIKQLKKLVFLSLRRCKDLVELPDSICKLSSVKSLILHGCSKLERLPKALGTMISLTEFIIGKTKIEELPDAIGSLEKLEKLSISECRKLVKLPRSMGKLRLLHHFDMWETGIVELPEDFGRLSSLQFLSLSSNELCSLPVSFSCLSCLQTLYLSSCGIVELLEDFGRLSSLKFLNLSFNKLCSLPVSFSCLSCLQTLDLSSCGQLQSLPDLPSSLIKLKASGCISMERLPELSNLKFLQELDLSYCGKLSEIQGISDLPLLQKLWLRRCTTLQSLPELPSSLVTLDISQCISMEILPNLTNLKNLEHICLDKCKKLVEIQGMKGLILLQKLYLLECGELQSLPELPSGNLRELFISDCRNLSKIQGISCLPRLQMFTLQYCEKLQSLPELPLENLRKLVISNCRNLSKIQGISCLPRLQILSLGNCEKLQSLPMLPSSLVMLGAYCCSSMERLQDMSNLKNLEDLHLCECNNLAEIHGISDLPLLRILNLKYCSKLQSLPKLPSSLIRLKAYDCCLMERLPDMSNMKNLEALDLWKCNNLAEIHGIGDLPLLQTLNLQNCSKLQSLPKLPSSLIRLEPYDCCLMERLPDMSNLKILEVLNLRYCNNLAEIHGINGLPLLQRLNLEHCTKLRSLPKLPSSLIRLEAYACRSLERLPDMSNLKSLEILNLKFCHNIAEIRGLEGLESLIDLCLYECHTCVQNLQKTVAQGILPSASDKLEVKKQYLIPDDDSINGMVFFLVFKLSRSFSDYPSDNIFIDIKAEVKRKNCERIHCRLRLRLEGWKNTDIVDQFYSCYFQGLTWFGFPLKKGDIFKLSQVSPNLPYGFVTMKMAEFVVADEAMEDGQQLEKGVKHLITCIHEQNVLSQTKMLNISQILSENSRVVQP